VRVCLMIEGQEDVSWQQWLDLARACDETDIEALFRSDHYLSVEGRAERGSLDAWTTLAGLAAVTRRVRLGTLVSPVTFRHPSALAKAVVTCDHISGGRVELGLGASWHEEEHRAYGFPFPEPSERLEMLAEHAEIVHREWAEKGMDFDGKHYSVRNLDALPKPVQNPHPNLILGGGGGRRSLAIAARWADEYNVFLVTPEKSAAIRSRAENAWRAAGRDHDSLVFSLMTGCIVGSNGGDLEKRARAIMDRRGANGSVKEWLDERRDALVIGTTDEAIARLRVYEGAGVQRIMLQHQMHDDVEMVGVIGTEIAPEVRTG
jgi:F420-dependent oxidoreductase-like protein